MFGTSSYAHRRRFFVTASMIVSCPRCRSDIPMRLPAITRWMIDLSGKIDRFCISELLQQSHPSRGGNKSMDSRFLRIIPVSFSCSDSDKLDLCQQSRSSCKSVRHQENVEICGSPMDLNPCISAIVRIECIGSTVSRHRISSLRFYKENKHSSLSYVTFKS